MPGTAELFSPSFPYKMMVTSQGAEHTFQDPEELREWIEKEKKFWSDLNLSSTLAISRMQRVDVDVAQFYLHKLASLDEEDILANFQAHLFRAEKMELLIGQSALGEALARAVDEDAETGTWLVAVLTLDLIKQFDLTLRDSLERSRALVVLSPAFLGAQGLARIAAEDKASREAAKSVANALATSRTIISETEDRLAALRDASNDWRHEQQADWSKWQKVQEAAMAEIRDIYHKQVQTEAAAIYWQRKATFADRISWVALCIFATLTLAPVFSLIFWWLPEVEAFIDNMLAASNGTFTLTPVVVLSIPVLAYAWVMRQLSRIFIQNRTIADDASYRQVMTMTYLGLSKDPETRMNESERAIILNALFRPSPPNTNDDGPPAGLIDILNNKKA